MCFLILFILEGDVTAFLTPHKYVLTRVCGKEDERFIVEFKKLFFSHL